MALLQGGADCGDQAGADDLDGLGAVGGPADHERPLYADDQEHGQLAGGFPVAGRSRSPAAGEDRRADSPAWPDFSGKVPVLCGRQAAQLGPLSARCGASGAEEQVAAILGIPDDVTQIALLAVGYTTTAEFHPARRPPIEEITYYDHWG
jgi:hypothetical protein